MRLHFNQLVINAFLRACRIFTHITILTSISCCVVLKVIKFLLCDFKVDKSAMWNYYFLNFFIKSLKV